MEEQTTLEGEGARGVLLQRIMRRQAALSIRVAAIFVGLLIALPLANLYLPKLMAADASGFTFSWLVLGVLFFPITWALSAYFVRKSEIVEAELSASNPRRGAPAAVSQPELIDRAVNDSEAGQ
ncbi:DUF485 domain-containing protein [Fimbriimonas ginsengisoli]|uniref:DUF485 domain-containing protein n=1 Tax=Fimbriimonas ginsengisoli TaxID=1005039 RepID=UPI00046CD0AC|nr:DUF485 domain-containing protein [Fimbriimonas ginsengisoli]